MQTLLNQPQPLVLLFLASLSSLCYGLDPKPKITASSLQAHMGSPFELSCTIENAISTITPTWEFRKTGAPSFRTLSTGLIPDDQLNYGLKVPANNIYVIQVRSVNMDHAGSYRCAVQFSTLVKISDTVDVEVVQAPIIDPMNTSSDQTVDLKNPVSLTCSAAGIPKPRIKWERAGRGMFPRGGFVYVGETLDFPVVEPSHNGPYICTAVNDIASATRVINLYVTSPPVVTITTRNLRQKQGYQLKLMCEAFANPPVEEVLWFRTGSDGRKRLGDDRYQVSSFEAAGGKIISKLVINGVRSSDYSATFECTASNIRGESTDTQPVRETSVPQKIGCSPKQTGSQFVLSTILAIVCLTAARIV